MADITKCKDEECPMKYLCLRYMAEPSELQSYFSESPRIKDECNMFIKIRIWDGE